MPDKLENPGDPMDKGPAKPRRKKSASPRKPRVVKPRAYRLFRIHHRGDCVKPGGAQVNGMIAEEMIGTYPDKCSAREWLNVNANNGDEYLCVCVLFVAKAVQKTAIEIE